MFQIEMISKVVELREFCHPNLQLHCRRFDIVQLCPVGVLVCILHDHPHLERGVHRSLDGQGTQNSAFFFGDSVNVQRRKYLICEYFGFIVRSKCDSVLQTFVLPIEADVLCNFLQVSHLRFVARPQNAARVLSARTVVVFCIIRLFVDICRLG